MSNKRKPKPDSGNVWSNNNFTDISQLPKAAKGVCPSCNHGKLGRKTDGTLECAFCNERFKEQKGSC